MSMYPFLIIPQCLYLTQIQNLKSPLLMTGLCTARPLLDLFKSTTKRIPSTRWIIQHFCNDCHWFSDGIRDSAHKYGTWLYMLTEPSCMLLHILEAFYFILTELKYIYLTQITRGHCEKAKEYKNICPVLIDNIKCTTVWGREHSQHSGRLWTATLKTHFWKVRHKIPDWLWVGHPRFNYKMWLVVGQS
jgi:hypothetical protein